MNNGRGLEKHDRTIAF